MPDRNDVKFEIHKVHKLFNIAGEPLAVGKDIRLFGCVGKLDAGEDLETIIIRPSDTKSVTLSTGKGYRLSATVLPKDFESIWSLVDRFDLNDGRNKLQLTFDDSLVPSNFQLVWASTP